MIGEFVIFVAQGAVGVTKCQCSSGQRLIKIGISGEVVGGVRCNFVGVV